MMNVSEKNQWPESRGFTLIELLVVIGIISLIFAAIWLTINQVIATGRDVKRLADMNIVQQALRRFEIDHGSIPGDPAHPEWDPAYGELGKSSALTILVTEGYIPNTPRDPKFSGDDNYNYSNHWTNTCCVNNHSDQTRRWAIRFRTEEVTHLGL